MPCKSAALCLLFAISASAAEPSAGGKGFNMDYGPAFAYTINCRNFATNGVDDLALKGIAVRLDGSQQAAVCFDTELLRYAAGWTGGFLDLTNTHLTSYKGSREAFIAGEIQFRTRPVAGWSGESPFTDPRPLRAGPLPRDAGRWKGLYRQGRTVALHYSIGKTEVHDVPGCQVIDGQTIFTRTVSVSETTGPLEMLVCDGGKDAREIISNPPGLIAVQGTNVLFAKVVGAPPGACLRCKDGHVSLRLPKLDKRSIAKVFLWASQSTNASSVATKIRDAVEPFDLASIRAGGRPLWPQPIVTKGRPGLGRGAYVVDTITVPEQNPWRSWMRLVAFDFFRDGTAAVSTWNGDVWLVSGIDAALQKVAWKRFAAGLHEPLGLKIVDDVVHVLGRDGITRLLDANSDGEADYYENFNNDVPISPSYHAFAMDLDTDRAGNFYHTRCGQRVDPALPLNGGMVRVSHDGAKAELIATGLRAANGLGIGPNDEIVCSDNQGNWIPSSRINLIRPGKFYGFTPHARTADPPTDQEKPICWLPISVDNSSGSQCWVTSERWGPLAGNLLHTSYGKSALFLLMTEQVDGEWQGGVFQLPLKFESGIMRLRFHPTDGQLYVCGLKGWQTTGARDGALQRVRFTGQSVRMPRELHVKPQGIELGFTVALNPESATDAQNWAIQQWNYRWTEAYGSDDYSVQDPTKKGRDSVEMTAIELAPDGRNVLLKLPKLQPVMQMRIQFRVKAADGESIAGEVYNTINGIPVSLTRR